jgi:hypothetical protein
VRKSNCSSAKKPVTLMAFGAVTAGPGPVVVVMIASLSAGIRWAGTYRLALTTAGATVRID